MSEHKLCRFFNKGRKLLQQSINRCNITLVLWAKTFLCPCIRITTVTATTDISFEPNFMALVVSFLKAVLTYNTCRVLLTSLTFPRYVSIWKSFCTYTLARLTIFEKLIYRQLMINLPKHELFALIKVLTELKLQYIFISSNWGTFIFLTLVECAFEDLSYLRGVSSDHGQVGHILLSRRE